MDDQSWDFVDEAVRRLEESWRTGAGPDLARFIPPEKHPCRERALIELIKVDQEHRWKSGERKTLEEYLGQWPELSGKAENLAELLEAECLTRAFLDQIPTHPEIAERFPHVADRIDLAKIEAEARRGADRASSNKTRSLGTADPSERLGCRIGPYKLLSVLGEGGFGIVYLAEQDRPVRRRVALKIIKPGMDTKQVIARFEAERQALAMMDHPHIARVFDAGATDAGRSYFAMELIHGEPITDYCDRHKLTIEQRLELFVPVCQAVQHAHQKGLIHRDLKPSNVLIAIRDDQPVAKIIDFGVAKAMAQPLTERTLFTEQGQIIGTPAYMSPEQAEMTSLDIDTRSDIYSLGVLLYELLTGALPFDREALQRAGFAEIQRIIREVEPPKPSTKLSSLGDDSTRVAQKRRIDPVALRRRLRGELDWIIMKAIEKDRTRRYATAAALAEDIQRYMKQEPVEAGPPGAVYRLRKFLRRHRRKFATTAFLLLVAAGVLAFAATQESRARRAKSHRVELLTDEADGFIKAGSFKEAEEVYAKVLGLDETDTHAREGVEFARRERELAQLTESVNEHIANSRFDQAQGMAEAAQVRFPNDPRIRTLLRQARGTGVLQMEFDLGTVTRTSLQKIGGSGAGPDLGITKEGLLRPAGIAVDPGWYRLSVEYSSDEDKTKQPAHAEYFLHIRRFDRYRLHAQRLLVGGTPKATYSNLQAALRQATPGSELLLAPGEYDLNSGTITTPNVTIRSQDPNNHATIRLGRDPERSQILNTWDVTFAHVTFAGTDFRGGTSNPRQEGQIVFDGCAMCKIWDTRLVSTYVHVKDCEGMVLRGNTFGCHDDQAYVHHRAYFVNSLRSVIIDNVVQSSTALGWRAFAFNDCHGILVEGNTIHATAVTQLLLENCSDLVIAGNAIWSSKWGSRNVYLLNTNGAIVAFNEMYTQGQCNVSHVGAGVGVVSHNILAGGHNGVEIQGAHGASYEYNVITGSEVGIHFAGGGENRIVNNMFIANACTLAGEEMEWWAMKVANNVMDKAILASDLGRTRLRIGEDNVVCQFAVGAPNGSEGRCDILKMEGNGSTLIKGSEHAYGPALGLKKAYVSRWRTLANGWAHCELPTGPRTWNSALGERLCKESAGVCKRVANSFDSLNGIGLRLSLQKQRSEAASVLQEAFGGTLTNAELAQLVAEVTGQRPDAAQAREATISRLASLRAWISAIPDSSPAEQRRLYTRIQEGLDARPASELTLTEVALALSMARALASSGNEALALQAYRNLAKSFAGRDNENLLIAAKGIRAIASQLLLQGRALEMEGKTSDGANFGTNDYRGKVFLLCLWDADSPPDRLSLLDWQRLFDLYHDRGFDIVVATEVDNHVLDELPEGRLCPWTIVRGQAFVEGQPLAAVLGTIGEPRALLVGKNGSILAIPLRAVDLDRRLAELLGPPYVPAGTLTPVDLKPQANQALDKGVRECAENGLQELDKGEHAFGGIAFTVPEDYLHLGSKQVSAKPKTIEGIRVNKKFVRLYLLHATRWSTAEGTAVGWLTVHYEDQTTRTIRIVYGEDLRDWNDIDGGKPVTRGTVVWTGQNSWTRKTGSRLRLYLSVWENPQPDKEVTHVDYTSAETAAAPFCVAMTVEETPKQWLELVGKTLDVEGTTVQGTAVRWADYRGKVVLVEFFASDSVRWRRELPRLRREYRRYHDRGFEMIGVGMDHSRVALKRFLDKERLPWAVLFDDGAEARRPMAARYAVTEVPADFLIDREGHVVSLHARAGELQTLLKNMLGPPFAPAGTLSYLDLQPKSDAELTTNPHGDVAENNLAELPTGEQTLGGVKFRVGNGFLQLAGNAGSGLPKAIQGIACNKAVSRVFILHGTATLHALPINNGTVIGHYRVNYEDGTAETIPIVYGVDVRDWWDLDRSKPVGRGTVVWVGRNAASRKRNATIRLYLSVWENPAPDKKVVGIDFFSTRTTAAPFCVAVTVEEAATLPRR